MIVGGIQGLAFFVFYNKHVENKKIPLSGREFGFFR
jgi:hypothetical protein